MTTPSAANLGRLAVAVGVPLVWLPLVTWSAVHYGCGWLWCFTAAVSGFWFYVTPISLRTPDERRARWRFRVAAGVLALLGTDAIFSRLVERWPDALQSIPGLVAGVCSLGTVTLARDRRHPAA